MFLALLAVPAFLPPESAQARLTSEYDSSALIFGEQKVGDITQHANSAYQTVVGGLGLENLIESGYVKRKDVEDLQIAKGLNNVMSITTNRYLESMLLQIYGVFFRGALMLHWLVYVGVFLIAAIVDGAMQRKVKQELIQMNAPIKFALGLHAAIFMVFLPLAYLLLPIAVTPWFMPIWAVVIAYPMAKAIANAVKTR